MDKALDILKVIFEKYMAPAIVSAATAIAIFSLTGDDFWLLEKLGRWLYMGLWFLIVMAAILSALFLLRRAKESTDINRQRREYQENVDRELEKKLLDIVDSLTDDERRKVFYFLNNKNQPIVMAGTFGAYGNNFLDRYCDTNEFIVGQKGLESRDFFTLRCDAQKLKCGSMATRFRLKDEFYDELVWLKNKRGSISRFE